MSFYNMMCGNNPLYGLFARVIETTAPLPEVPRFRDVYTRMKDGRVEVVIYIRTGGGNREGYEDANGLLESHPLHVENFDDDFDSTFAHFVFKVPDEWQERLLRIHELWSRHPKGFTPRQKFDGSLASLKNEGQPEFPKKLSDKEAGQLSRLLVEMADALPAPSSLERQFQPEAFAKGSP